MLRVSLEADFLKMLIELLRLPPAEVDDAPAAVMIYILASKLFLTRKADLSVLLTDDS